MNWKLSEFDCENVCFLLLDVVLFHLLVHRTWNVRHTCPETALSLLINAQNIWKNIWRLRRFNLIHCDDKIAPLMNCHCGSWYRDNLIREMTSPCQRFGIFQSNFLKLWFCSLSVLSHILGALLALLLLLWFMIFKFWRFTFYILNFIFVGNWCADQWPEDFS